MAGLHTLRCLCHRAGLPPNLSTPLPPCARCGMTTTTLQNHPLQGGGVTRSANQSLRSWVSNLWGGRGHAGGGHRVVWEGPRPWEECTCPERRGTRGRPAAEAQGPVSKSGCPVRSWTGQGRQSPAEEDLSLCPVPQREGKTQITTIVPRADRAERKVSGPRQSGERQGGEMLCKTGGGHCGKKGTTRGLRGQDRVPGAVPGR